MDDDNFIEDEEEASLGDFDLDDQDEFDEEIPLSVPQSETDDLPSEPQAVSPAEDVPHPPPEPKPCAQTSDSQSLVAASDVPVQLKIELGRLHMTADKLLHLQPGNFLELDQSPDHGVDLVVNGERIGRGELIRVGDAIGVRITRLG